MAKYFAIPEYYRSSRVTLLKRVRAQADPLRRDLTPTLLDFGALKIALARHFGFCYGVENAIETAYRALAENPQARVFLLSEIIHNAEVNGDLQSRGVRFIFDASGAVITPLDELDPRDVVIVPAFGTTLELLDGLQRRGIDPRRYNSTCPFVEKVWKRGADLGRRSYTVVVHGKPTHEETRATVSHVAPHSPVVVVRDATDAGLLCRYIRGEATTAEFWDVFSTQTSDGFDPHRDLVRLGVVNQTTMLAEETVDIANGIREALARRYGKEVVEEHFADTRDTLCYATTENQRAASSLATSTADLALVVGGFNSSNTSHLAELCAKDVATYFVSGADGDISPGVIKHFDLQERKVVVTNDWLIPVPAPTIALTAGASCPDSVVERVVVKVVSFFPAARSMDEVFSQAISSTGV